MNINHQPILDTQKIIDVYSKKDRVEITYVCSTEFGKRGICDIFFRETPHPKFGNRYFGLYHDHLVSKTFIFNADSIDGQVFGMIYDGQKWHYSSHRHDYKKIGEKIIDGGREYIRGNGIELFKLKDGVFIKQPNRQ